MRQHISQRSYITRRRRISLKKALDEASAFFMAAELGFEPRQTESESVVLPLHNSATNSDYYTQYAGKCQYFF